MSEREAALTTEAVFATLEVRDGRRIYRETREPRREFASATTTTTTLGSFVVVTAESEGIAREQELLAAPETALHELYAILAGSGLSPCFPPAVQREVEAWLAQPGLTDADLRDLEALPFVTIDGKHSKDLDQALYLTREAGQLTVYYAIADASYYVRPGTPLFGEAMNRGASFYLPGVVIPMLPKALSEGLISLNPGVPRRAIVFVTRLGSDGKVFETTVCRGRIRSCAKLHFEQVQAFYDAPRTSDLSHAAFASSLTLLREFAELRSALAQEQNVVRHRRAEVETHVSNEFVRRFVVTQAIRRPVESYNEQLSLLCNAEGARLLELASERPLVEPIFRVHPPPESQPTEAFRAMTKRVAELHGLTEAWIWQTEQPLAQYLAALPTEPRAISDAISRQAVMLNVGSSFQSRPGGHFGVGSPVYARFSAPMREMVGVYLHRELTQALGHAATDDDALRDAVVERANQARQTQKRVTNASNLLVLDQVFNDQLKDPELQLWASVVGLTSSKIHVVLESPPIDAKIHLADLRKQWGQSTKVSRDSCEVHVDGRVRVRLGDRVQLLVLSHGATRQHWQLGIARDG
jgi:ribonuclease R